MGQFENDPSRVNVARDSDNPKPIAESIAIFYKWLSFICVFWDFGSLMTKDLCRPADIAKWFINRADREAGDDMTHLKLQKLLYFAQAWHLANLGVPLFQEEMEAWTHGPVVPSVWHEYKGYQWDSIPPTKDVEIDKNVADYLEKLYRKYGRYSGKALEELTHSHEPWQKTRGELPLEAKCTDPIDKKLIRDFYAKRIGKSWS